MSGSKIGRPTEEIKDSNVKVRIDESTKKMLEYCVKVTNMSRSEIIRDGIKRMYDDIKGEIKE